MHNWTACSGRWWISPIISISVSRDITLHSVTKRIAINKKKAVGRVGGLRGGKQREQDKEKEEKEEEQKEKKDKRNTSKKKKRRKEGVMVVVGEGRRWGVTVEVGEERRGSSSDSTINSSSRKRRTMERKVIMEKTRVRGNKRE